MKPKKAPKRKPISKKTRFDVFKRDGFVCQYCGNAPSVSMLHVDHITPVALGGDNDPDNLATSCAACNLGKSATPLTDIPQSLKDKAGEVKEREAQIVGYNKIIMGKQSRLDDESWLIVEKLEGREQEQYSSKKLLSIKGFLKKLPLDEVIDAAEIARSGPCTSDAGKFKYFCGVCWRKMDGYSNG